MASGSLSAGSRETVHFSVDEYLMTFEDGDRRLKDLEQFYTLLNELAQRLGGPRHLADCHGRMSWPVRGVYFFFEAGEVRRESGAGLRVVRVGTHALTATSRTSLWNRLSNHRGQANGGGNHRGSIFRLLVGTALKARAGIDDPVSWGIGSEPGAAARRLGVERAALVRDEATLEAEVSQLIGAMPFVWLAIDDPPGPESRRGYIERNAIALLSNSGRESLDGPSGTWLGRYCARERVRQSGLWNQNHTEDDHEPAFLGVLRDLMNAA